MLPEAVEQARNLIIFEVHGTVSHIAVILGFYWDSIGVLLGLYWGYIEQSVD